MSGYTGTCPAVRDVEEGCIAQAISREEVLSAAQQLFTVNRRIWLFARPTLTSAHRNDLVEMPVVALKRTVLDNDALSQTRIGLRVRTNSELAEPGEMVLRGRGTCQQK